MPIPLAGPALAPTLPFPETRAAHVRSAAQSASTQRWGRYVVRPGDTLLALALARGTSIEEVVARNMLGSSATVLRPGQVLALPGGTLSGPTGQYVERAGGQARAGEAIESTRSRADGSHVVRPGQTLGGIAARYGMSGPALRAANGLSSDVIRPGQRLWVPQGRAAARTQVTASRARAAGTRTVIATVRPGDGLLAIAQRYGVSRVSILKANDLAPGTMLRAGQRLRIVGTRVAGPAPTSQRISRTVEHNRAILRAADVPTRAQVRHMVAEQARRHGVDPVLAVAIAFQESGWSQRAVSHANAIGVMQCLPSTAGWVSGHVGRDLDLLDTRDNITCGVALLRSLTRSARTTDEVIGAYYQGLTSVRQNGYYPDTTRYVVQVRAHMKRLADR